MTTFKESGHFRAVACSRKDFAEALAKISQVAGRDDSFNIDLKTSKGRSLEGAFPAAKLADLEKLGDANELEIRIGNYSADPSIRIRLDRSIFGSCKFDVEGTSDLTVEHVALTTRNSFKALRPWWWPIATWPTRIIAYALSTVSAMWLIVAFTIDRTTIATALAAWLLCVGLFLVSVLMPKIRIGSQKPTSGRKTLTRTASWVAVFLATAIAGAFASRAIDFL